jgi:uncharacterized membrane protein SpoIIM required for sporulation
MIIDLPRFIAAERPAWAELEQLLDRLDRDPGYTLTVEQAKHFHFLYQKVSADLARIATFSSEPGLRSYLESLVARAYGEIHETREHGRRFAFLTWFTRDFPRVFRKHWNAFLLSLAVTIAGTTLGGFAVILDPEAKEAILPGMFANHLGDPRKRVEEEEKGGSSHLGLPYTTFAGALMVNNIKVSIFTLALGMTFGVGTIVELFYNGLILGLVAVDYIMAGQIVFLLGWLMPHGVVEIPAILLAGQGGLMLGKALIGWGDRNSLRLRMSAIGPDLMTLIGGVAVMLVWAGIVESYLSQHHKPVLPYAVKIVFGMFELVALVWFLGFSGRKESAA